MVQHCTTAQTQKKISEFPFVELINYVTLNIKFNYFVVHFSSTYFMEFFAR